MDFFDVFCHFFASRLLFDVSQLSYYMQSKAFSSCLWVAQSSQKKKPGIRRAMLISKQ
jgi:hypothetical protein